MRVSPMLKILGYPLIVQLRMILWKGLLLIYQEPPDISEDSIFLSIIPLSGFLLIFKCYQDHRNSCPCNNTAGTYCASQCTSKDPNMSFFCIGSINEVRKNYMGIILIIILILVLIGVLPSGRTAGVGDTIPTACWGWSLIILIILLLIGGSEDK